MLSTHRMGKDGARCTRSFSLAGPPKACRATTLHAYVIKRRSGVQSSRLPGCSYITERDFYLLSKVRLRYWKTPSPESCLIDDMSVLRS